MVRKPSDAVKAAAAIKGWMRVVDLEWLAEQASRSLVIVEVGVWKGRSLRALCDNVRPSGLVYGVDHFQGSVNERTTHHKEAATPKGSAKLRATAISNLEDHIHSGLLTLVEMDSLAAVERLRPALTACGGADFIFIDACHKYEAVVADITAWRPLVKPGGVLGGHDFQHRSVKKALRECLPGSTRAGRMCWSYGIPK